MSDEDRFKARDDASRSSQRNVEVRVIGGGGSEPDVREFGRRNEILPEFEEDSMDEIVRLENEKGPVAVRPTDQIAAGEKSRRSKRKRKPRESKSARASGVWLMGLAAVVLAVAAVILVTKSGSSTEEDLSSLLAPAGQSTRKDDGVIEARTLDYPDKVMRLLKRYAAARTYREVIPLVRNGELLGQRLAREWEPLDLTPEKVDDLELRLHMRDEAVWLTATGEDSKFEPINLILMPRGQNVELDWEATTGAGDVPFSRLRELPPGEQVMMRVVAGYSEATNYHTSDFPEEVWRCFRLRDRLDRHSVWGYARRGSAVERAMAEGMNESSVFLQRLSEVPLILKLKSTGSAARGQFELTELVQTGWIEP